MVSPKTLFQALRRDFSSKSLKESGMAGHPMTQFKKWFHQAAAANLKDANAFVLATAAKNGRPSARVLLMKGWSERGITFFTNYASAKGRQIAANPHGEAVFFWNAQNRQIRLSGRIVKLSRKISEDYFYSRPYLAQLAASVSDQSRPISDRKLLERKFEQLKKSSGSKIKMPDNWGGYELRISHAEFWQGRPNRLHDRVVYTPTLKGRWRKVRLQP